MIFTGLLSLIAVVSSSPINDAYNYNYKLQYQTTFNHSFINEDDETDLYNYLITYNCNLDFNSVDIYEFSITSIVVDLTIVPAYGNETYYEFGGITWAEPVILGVNGETTIEVNYNDSYDEIDLVFDFGSASRDCLLEDTRAFPYNIYSGSKPTLENIWYTALTIDVKNLVTSYFNNNYDSIYQVGYVDGKADGYADGKVAGYSEGLSDGLDSNGQPAVIFSGILSVAFIPVNFFLSILNFEVFGINIGGFVTGLLTLAIILIIIRIIMGSGVKSAK